jgi:hypothetical protein
MKLVREHINEFQQGGNPYDTMNIGSTRPEVIIQRIKEDLNDIIDAFDGCEDPVEAEDRYEELMAEYNVKYVKDFYDVELAEDLYDIIQEIIYEAKDDWTTRYNHYNLSCWSSK